MSRCAYLNCTNTRKESSMFAFPVHDKDRLLLWIIHSGNSNFTSLTDNELTHRYICAAHFRPDSIHQGEKRGRLLGPAVPIHYQLPESDGTSYLETLYSRCAVLGCPNKARHRFPRNEVVRKKWIEVLKLDHQRNIGWHLSAGSSVCSQHFKPSDYDIKYDLNGVQRFKRLKNHSIPSIFPWSIYKEPSFDARQATKTYSRKERPLAFVPELAFMDSTTCDNTEIDPLQTDAALKIEPLVDNDDSLQYIIQENMSFDVEIVNNITDQCLNAQLLPTHEEIYSNDIRIKSEIAAESNSNDIRIKSEITGDTDSNENRIKSEINGETDSNENRIKSEINGETDSNENIIKSEITTETDSVYI